jgi:dihydrofolate reductase
LAGRGRTTTSRKAKRPGEDAAWLSDAFSRVGAVVAGRWTYESAGRWGDKNPWELPLFIVTHPPEEEPDGAGFTFVAGVKEAVARAAEAAGDKDVHVMGGADVIRQALEAGLVDELTIIIAPVVLGGGKRLFEGFSSSLDLEHLGVRQSQHATFIDYRVERPRWSGKSTRCLSRG